jgi:transcription initiation factor IIE alpha subunit
VFLNFICPDCIFSASEDDFEYHVRCPDCHGNLEENSCIGRVEIINGGVTEEGKVWFECSDCGNDAEGYISTKWDAAQS